MRRPDYTFSPSLLDDFQRMLDTKPEDYFYRDETGAWHLNWNEAEGTFHYSEEEVDALLKREFLDRVNKVPTPPSEAASKGTAFNEILDCIVKRRKPSNPTIVIKTVRNGDDLLSARKEKALRDARSETAAENMTLEGCVAQYTKIGVPFIYASLDGFEFFFDKAFCTEAAEYFKGSVCQCYTKCRIEIPMGSVELHGYMDYLREDTVFDCKTTRRYTFGDYQKRWQRFVYPFSLIESGTMGSVGGFEFTVYVLSGGTQFSPLITGTQYREYYTYDHKEARSMLMQQCERLAEFLEENWDSVTNMKVYGMEL